MAVIFQGLRRKLRVTIRTVGFGWGTYGNRRHSGCVLKRDTVGAGVVVICFQAPLRRPLALQSSSARRAMVDGRL